MVGRGGLFCNGVGVLKGIHPLLTAELLFVLGGMGHGDEIAIVDGNFPAATLARRLVTSRGVDSAAMIEAILTVLPLDREDGSAVMMRPPVSTGLEVTGVPDIRNVLERTAAYVAVSYIDRHQFYERARNACAIVATGERRPYGNVILVTGVVGADESRGSER